MELSECSAYHRLGEIMVVSSGHKYIVHIQHWILSVSEMILSNEFYTLKF